MYSASGKEGITHASDCPSGWTFQSHIQQCIIGIFTLSGVACFATVDCGPSVSAEMKDWDVSSVTNMRSVFMGAPLFNADISSWDVSSVTDMHRMFSDASAFNADMSSWDVSSVADIGWMFKGLGRTLVPRGHHGLEQALIDALNR